ncbi:MAG: tetratricopeptide repeat protein, partial [Sphingomonadales bacterium]|nr:tetratricopeptide repeat protein [Sphingomonadales bacterium]
MANLQQQFAEGQRALQSGDHAGAASIFAGLVREHPEQPAVFHMLGLSLKKQGKPEEARDIFTAAVERHGSIAALHAELASLLDDLGEGGAAVEAYDRAIALDPRLLDARIDRALARHRHLDTVGGYRDLQSLAEEHPGSARIQLNLGLVARKLGLLDESTAAVARVLELAPDSFKALRLDAQLAMDRGRPAVELFR